MTVAGSGRRRAVVLVANPAAPYSRGLRVARTLEAEGYAVEIAAVASALLPEREHDGRVSIRRYAPSGPFASIAPTYAGPDVSPRSAVTAASGPSRLRRRPIRVAGRVLADVRRWLLWPHTVRGWWATLERELEPADLYHACGSLTVAAALRARHRHPIGPAGLPAIVIYDAIDDVMESNNVLGMPRVVRAWLGRRERRWARAADGRTTVNEALAERLARHWATEPPVVVANYPEPSALGVGETRDLIRHALDLPATTRIVLFQGRLGPNLGLELAAEAALLVPDAALVLVGFGRWLERTQARDADPRFRGHHFTLPPQHPDALAEWTASADVSIVPLPPVSINQRLSSPNKLWESLAAGTPVVVGPHLELMARLVRDDRLGAVADADTPVAFAAAIADVLDRPAAERATERVRIATLARSRFSWPIAASAYRELIRRLEMGRTDR